MVPFLPVVFVVFPCLFKGLARSNIFSVIVSAWFACFCKACVLFDVLTRVCFLREYIIVLLCAFLNHGVPRLSPGNVYCYCESKDAAGAAVFVALKRL